ncbi:hypothetical protein DFR29_13317 [Tahibacter aquaticus]|uniref:Uncharacterized protein n=1 Tax=Tahibacter aquaticus TaxID=520092 RepID=A0A4R6YGS8_9GAMM|nr:hypothetical protein DFR29_13317 [Tahibacter aquaticus]
MSNGTHDVASATVCMPTDRVYVAQSPGRGLSGARCRNPRPLVSPVARSAAGLDVGKRPVLDSLGKTVLEPNPGHTPYRFSDGSQAAPRRVLQVAKVAQEAREATVGLALQGCIDHRKGVQGCGKVKAVGVDGATDSLARLARPEAGLAEMAIASLIDGTIKIAWKRLRHSAMDRSNRVPAEIKKKLVQAGGWWCLVGAFHRAPASG